MDSYREIDADTGPDKGLGEDSAYDVYDDDAGDDAVMDARHSFGNDERRMHVRAYNFWAGLLDDKNFPSIEDFDPDDIEDFGPQSVLLDFTAGLENPAISFSGRRFGPRVQHRGRYRIYQRRSPAIASVTHNRPLYADYRQSGADRIRSRIREPARCDDTVPRHIAAFLLRRRHDRFHLRRHQLEGNGRSRNFRRAERGSRPGHGRRDAAQGGAGADMGRRAFIGRADER